MKELENIFVKKLRLMLTHNLKHLTVDNKEFKLFFSNIDLNVSNINYNLIEIKYYLFLIQKNIRILLKNLINDQFQKDFYEIDRSISSLSSGEILSLIVKINYELIIFTSATKDYADPLIDAIEKKEKYFDFRLYRHHTIICNNEFVKDIGRLGRPMNKLIIVDNLPQNFRLQKENGIMIKAFWGEDVYDTALYELSTILNKIANEFYDTRKGINAYKNDILSKVSSCFSKADFCV